MKLSNKSMQGFAVVLLVVAIVSFLAWRAYVVPASTVIESVAMQAGQTGASVAKIQLQAWAQRGSPVAQRELGLLLRTDLLHRDEAMALFARAARSGDAQASFHLGEMYRAAAQPALAWPWFRQAAGQEHAKAALMLGLMAKNGEGVARDDAEAARWLLAASELEQPHAMFLLSGAYEDGTGITRDANRARYWLEQAAEHEYPPALQELAMRAQTGDALAPKDVLRASHLMKEATEHRHNNWNRF